MKQGLNKPSNSSFTLYYIGIIMLCLISYGRTLNHQYGFDDHYVIDGNPKTNRGLAGILEILTSRYALSGEQEHGYRPVTLITFAVEYEIFGANPSVSHGISLLLYTLSCLLLFKLLKLLFKEYHFYLALFITLLFVIHPIHTEVVNNVKSRDELLCFLFALLTLWYCLKAVDTSRLVYYFLAIFFFFLSVFSKPTSLTFLAIIPVTLYIFRGLKPKKIMTSLLSIGLLIILFKFFKDSLLSEAAVSREAQFYENPLHESSMGFWGKIPMAAYSVWYYIKLFLIPHPLLAYYGYDQVKIVTWTDWEGVTSVVAILPLIAWGTYLSIKRSVLGYGIIYFLLAISIFSNLLKPAPGIIADRFLYLPSLGGCIALGWTVFRLFKVRLENRPKVTLPSYLWVVFVLITILSLAKIFTRNYDWKNMDTLLSADTKKAPRSVKLHTMAGTHFLRKLKDPASTQEKIQYYNRALHYYETATALYKPHAIAWNNKGTLYYVGGEYEKAFHCFQKAIQYKPEYPMALVNLGDYYLRIRNKDKAQEFYQKALLIDPRFERARKKLEAIYP